MANRGVAPPNPATNVGALRLLIDDTEYVPLDPPEAGYGDYTWFSDDSLSALLVASGDDVVLASGYAYQRMAASLALEAVNIATDDLRYSTEQRAETFRKLALDIIGGAVDLAGDTDIFMLAGGRPGYPCRAELAERPYGIV